MHPVEVARALSAYCRELEKGDDYPWTPSVPAPAGLDNRVLYCVDQALYRGAFRRRRDQLLRQ